MPRTLQDPSLDAQERKALEDVQRHGLHVELLDGMGLELDTDAAS